MTRGGPKVFGIGLGRTGSASLAAALNDLGIKAKHFIDDGTTQRELSCGSGAPRLLDRYQGIVGGIGAFFRQLDRAFPGSKFILTARDRASWLDARRRMAALERETLPRLHPDEVEVIRSIRSRLYGSAEFDERLYLDAYDRHVADVRTYFDGRSEDLLVMNIPGGDGWQPLCTFLGRPVPSTPFPHRNESRALVEWNGWVAATWAELAKLIPPGQRFVLVDDGELGFGDGRALPFLERNGRHWGPPPDDATAISEIERMRREGAGFIAFVSTSFWWLDHYAEFHRYLCSEFRRCVQTDRFVVFDMRRRASDRIAEHDGRNAKTPSRSQSRGRMLSPVARFSPASRGARKMNRIHRLNWGCGKVRPSDWINSDVEHGPGIDLACDIVLDGLPINDDEIEYISSQHALQQLKIYDILAALRELHRVLKPGGVLRLCLPDFDKAIETYRQGRWEDFWPWDWQTISGNFITYIMDYNFTRTPLTYAFVEELLRTAGFDAVRRVAHRETTSRYPDIVVLDSRAEESFCVEVFKAERSSATERRAPGPATQIHLSWTHDPATSLTVSWSTPSEDNPALLAYRAGGTEAWTSVPGSTTPFPGGRVVHRATIVDLLPASGVEYRVSSDRGVEPPMSGVFRTRTAPAPGPADFSFAWICDTGLVGRPDGNATGTRQIIEEIAAADPLFLLGGGDYAYADRDRRDRNVADAIDAWFEQMQPLIARVPFMAQYGNHEVLLGERFRDWAPRFAHPEGLDGGRNYSFDVGDAHFTALFVPAPVLRPDQLAWLDTDLGDARNRGLRWLIVYQHEPIYGNGHSHPADPGVREVLAPLFENHRVDLHLSGHDQSYERTYPLAGVPHDPAPTSRSIDTYKARRGVIYAKISPSGKKSDKRKDFSRFTAPQPDFIAVRDDTAHHYALVTVRACGEIVVNAYGVAGDGTPKGLLDSFRIIAADPE